MYASMKEDYDTPPPKKNRKFLQQAQLRIDNVKTVTYMFLRHRDFCEGKNALSKFQFNFQTAQLAGAVEYTDCISAEG